MQESVLCYLFFLIVRASGPMIDRFTLILLYASTEMLRMFVFFFKNFNAILAL